VNGDGNLDLLIPLGQVHTWTTCNCGEEAGNMGMVVLLGNGDGTFANSTNGPFLVGWDSQQVVASDFNNDGAIDAAVLERAGNGNYGAASFVTMLINKTLPSAYRRLASYSQSRPSIPAARCKRWSSPIIKLLRSP
jgi:hypothetical protein